jgi:uncharacterized protein (TIGR03790 family)
MNVILAQLRRVLDGENLRRHLEVFATRLRGFACVLVLPMCAAASIAPAFGQFAPAASVPDFLHRRYDFSAPVAPALRAGQWIRVPDFNGHLTSKEIGLVINTADPYSVEVGGFYINARRLTPAQVLRVQLPVKQVLTPEEFKAFSLQVRAFFDAPVQALALAWTIPYAVNCNSITGALALGYDASLCDHPCSASRRSPYFDNPTTQPYTDLKMHLSMMLAARDVATAEAMITRGVASDNTLGLRGAKPVNAYFVTTNDVARSARSPLFPPAGLLRRQGVAVHVEQTQTIENANRVVVYLTGLAQVDKLDTIHWVPGALADHLTSYGGALGSGQMSSIDWIASGATATYGTVSEPCAHPQKFSHPQILLENYMRGATALEAYWRSVAWPQQGAFIGEPLAAPFARQ